MSGPNNLRIVSVLTSYILLGHTQLLRPWHQTLPSSVPLVSMFTGYLLLRQEPLQIQVCKSLTSSNEAQLNFETEPACALVSLASDRWCTSLRNANHTEEPLWVCCVTLWGSLEHSLGTSANDPSNSYDLNVTKEFHHNEQLLGEGEMITQE